MHVVVAALVALLSWPGSREPTGQAAPPAIFAVEPYLVDLDQGSATLAWRLSEEAGSAVEYGHTLDFELGRVESPVGIQHTVELTGLSPGALVHYRVARAFQGSFRTDDGDGEYRFAVVGHTHGSEQFGHYPDELLVARLAELELDFVLHTGDLTFYPNPAGFAQHYFKPFRSLVASTPVYAAPGNHDAGWPFVEGLDLTLFKELFAYDYDERSAGLPGQACYAIEKGNLQLLFFSYVSSVEKKSLNRRWLKERLADERFDFNVLVYGGGNPYFNEQDLLNWLSQFEIDCILNGDSLRKAQMWREEQGLRIAFVGTGSLDPHPLLYGELSPGVLTFRELDAAGQASGETWIHNRRERAPLASLKVGESVCDPERKMAWTPLKLEQPLASEGVHGIQLRVQLNVPSRRTIYVHTFPTTQTGEGPGYQTRPVRVGPGDELITLPLLSSRPNGEPYELRGLRVTTIGARAAGELDVLEAWIF